MHQATAIDSARGCHYLAGRERTFCAGLAARYGRGALNHQPERGSINQTLGAESSPVHEEIVMDTHSHNTSIGETDEDVIDPAEDIDNDPGNEDPGSQLDRDATVPLIDPDE